MTLENQSAGAPRDPEEVEASGGGTHPEISPLTSLGAVHLSVADLGRSLSYYTRDIGLKVLDQAAGRASLGTGADPLLVLEEVAGAQPSGGYTGLYHFALLLPQRVDLARWLAHASRDRVRVGGASDHFVSEALYLTDPDGHGIEIYWDRPRATWEGQVAARMTTFPLDIPDILGELSDPVSEPYAGMPAGTVMGHIHLKVSEIAGTLSFYEHLLGFGLMARFGSQAAFLSAGGYHHHLGTNTWESAGAQPAPDGSARLLRATVVLPDARERDRLLARVEAAGIATAEIDGAPAVSDLSGNRIVLAVG